MTQEYPKIHPSKIIIPAERQRKDLDIQDLLPSIRERGVYNAILVQDDMTLIAGHRRLLCAIELGIEVPYRLYGSLSPLECKIIELEENERRKDLPWREQCIAIADLHKLYSQKAEAEGEKWSLAKTAEMLFYAYSHIVHIMRVFRDLNNPRIAQAPGLRAAYNVLARLDDRAIGDAMSAIGQAGQALGRGPEAKEAVGPSVADAAAAVVAGLGAEPELPLTYAQKAAAEAAARIPPVPKVPAEELDILNLDFIKWAEGYAGPKFSFAHMDFPYGINAFAGPQSGRDKWTTYDDDPNVYWALIKAFCEHRDNFLSASAHVMFWFSMDYYTDTIELFAKLAPEIRIWPKPLIWYKSDNVGILSDPKRGPRHIYETALIMSRDDRLIVSAVSDCYAAPTDKAHHASTKPEPVLKHFMRMFVDEHTTMLDPTCGSGSSLRAAEALGAERVLGLELDPEHCANARSALRQARVKAALSKGVKS